MQQLKIVVSLVCCLVVMNADAASVGQQSAKDLASKPPLSILTSTSTPFSQPESLSPSPRLDMTKLQSRFNDPGSDIVLAKKVSQDDLALLDSFKTSGRKSARSASIDAAGVSTIKEDENKNDTCPCCGRRLSCEQVIFNLIRDLFAAQHQLDATTDGVEKERLNSKIAATEQRINEVSAQCPALFGYAQDEPKLTVQ